MWCPEGFVSWGHVLSGLQTASETTLSLVCLGGELKTTVNGLPKLDHFPEHYLTSSGIAASHSEAGLMISITTVFLMSRFFEDHPPVLVGADGRIVDPEPCLLLHKDRFDYCDYNWPLNEHSPFSTFFDINRKHRFGWAQLMDRFAFIDTETGLVRIKNGAAQFLVSHWYSSEQSAKVAVSAIKNLENFAICWRQVPSGREYRNFLGCIEVNDAFTAALDFAYGPSSSHQNPAQPCQAVGRPKKRDQAAVAYREMFPDGHEAAGLTWKVVLRKLEDKHGLSVSEATLKRGLAEL